MDPFYYGILLRFGFLICGNAQEQESRMIYYKQTATWQVAVQVCSKNGGVLESNMTLITQQYNSLNITGDTWIGQYKAWTPWYANWGCYEVRYAENFTYPINLFECQKLCSPNEYFAVKDLQCFCIEGNALIRKVQDYLPCNCCNCLHLYKQNITTDIKVPEDNSSQRLCLAAYCEPSVSATMLRLSAEDCKKQYKAKCDTGAVIEGFRDFDAASYSCQEMKSFIAWFPEYICSMPVASEYLQQYWTSAQRYIDDYIVHKQDRLQNIEPQSCLMGSKINNQVTFRFESTCSTIELPFFCSFNSTMQKDTSDRNKVYFCKQADVPQPLDETDIKSGAITAACILIGILIVVVILIVIFIYKRRKRIKSENNNAMTESTVNLPQSRQSTGYMEIDEFHLNSTKPKNDTATHLKSDSQTQSVKPMDTKTTTLITNQDFDIDTRENNVLNSTSNTSMGQYSLAKPFEKEMDKYVDIKDYDHLKREAKRKDTCAHKLYDHINMTSDSNKTYDHSSINSPKPVDYNYHHISLNVVKHEA